ncbi:MAG: 30S ribosomal protein S8 [Acidobacteria bacterium]|nr:30S ribosomal protein S8 [Acidobacteriota bacterium]
MIVTDPISDLLTRIRNGHMAKHDKVDIPSSRVKQEIVRILKDEGYIKNFKVVEPKGSFPSIRVYLKYNNDGHPVIHGLKRVSKPGRRMYRGKDKLPKVLGGLGISIITTSQGIMTDRQARELGVGGEILCSVW